MKTKNTPIKAAKLLNAALLNVVAVAAALTAQSAFAQNSGFYIGGNVGQANATVDDARITNGLASSGLTTTSITDRDRSTGFKLYGGYRLSPNFALEGGYFDLGKFGFTANTIPLGTLDGNIKVRGLNLDLVGMLPLTEKFSVLGRVGANYAQTRGAFSGTGAVGVTNPNPSKRDTNYKIGVGLQYAFTDALSVRGELERYRINDAVGNKGHIDMASVGLVYAFGAKVQTPPPPAPRAAMPEPVAIAVAPVVVPPPAPAPAPMPPPAPMRVSFSADSLFDFDKSAVKPAGKLALDKFAGDLKGTQYDAVKVTGHTDRIGSPAYNQKLSSRRAEAVSTYLVETGVASNKIAAQGVGSTNPVTKPGECVGNKPTAKLIACLQPDRRVEVEVTGTKPAR